MHITVSQHDGKTTVELKGRFDFATHKDFRSACEEILKSDRAAIISVDLGEVDYLDSSALGMLLLLRSKARATNRNVELTNVRGTVLHILKVANFGKLFPMD